MGRLTVCTEICNRNTDLRIGDDPDPMAGTPVNAAPFDTVNGSLIPTDGLTGRYVSVTKSTIGTKYGLSNISVFLECNTPKFPWDPFPDESVYLEPLKDTFERSFSLATAFEAAMGVDVCHELGFEVVGLPNFCAFEQLTQTFTCTPTSSELHGGLHEVKIARFALEYPLTVNRSVIQIEVPMPSKASAPAADITNIQPYFETPPPQEVVVQKTTGFGSWSLELEEPKDFEEESVSISVELGAADSFVNYDETLKVFQISDLSDDAVLAGNFTLTITLDDATEQSIYETRLIVKAVDSEELTEELQSNFTSLSNATNGTADEEAIEPTRVPTKFEIMVAQLTEPEK